MDKKGQYCGPQHFWNDHALNHREKYFYSYYGSYSPYTNLKYYKPLESHNSLPFQMEPFCGMLNNENNENNDYTLYILCVFVLIYVLFVKK